MATPTPVLEGKLVRDMIPEIIQANGDSPHTRILSLPERLPYLREKVLEEAQELFAALEAKDKRHIKSEIGDVVEVLRAIAREHDILWSDIENSAKDKRQLRGAFKRFICLISTESRK